VTIDPSDARDHDDALWAERMKDGGYRVLIAIADVAHYVRPGSAIDQEAFERGCSIYLPDRAIPMLPAELSSNLASLVPGKDRLTMAVMVELGPSGGVHTYELIEGVMRSRARITYDGAARALGFSKEPAREKAAEAHLETLEVLSELADILRKRRTKRGSLNFDLPEPRIKFEESTGEPIDVYRQKGDPGIKRAYGIVEEMMLLANEVVAEDLHSRRMPAVYRVHGTPDEDKLLKVCEMAHALGEKLDPDDAVVPKKLAKFVRRIEGKPNASTIHYLLLRAMQQAQYDTKCTGHFALAAKYYCHFTSPIRRYPDLCVHRALKIVIHDDDYDEDVMRADFKRAAIESSRLERRSVKLERDVMDLYRAILMQGRVGEEFDAKISGMAGHGFYSSFDSPFVDALTPVERLADWYEMDDLGVRMIGERTGTVFALGDPIRLRVETVSIDRREIVAVPPGSLSKSPEDVAERDRGPRRRSSRRNDRDGGSRKPGKGRRNERRRQSEKRRKSRDERRGRKVSKRGGGRGTKRRKR
jgi:ribonuclease R